MADTTTNTSTTNGNGTSSNSGTTSTTTTTSRSKSFYNKDLDLVQNMRNCFSVVSKFKEQVDAIVLASGYGGWTFITETVDPADRIEGLLYLRITYVGTGKNADGDVVNKYQVQAETYQGIVVAFYSDADVTYYDNSDSYFLVADNVKDALDELSHRSIVLYATIPAANFVYDAALDCSVAEVGVQGMLSSDYPNVTLIPSTTEAIAMKELAEAGHISRIETFNDLIKVYCYDGFMPTYDLNIIFRVLRT